MPRRIFLNKKTGLIGRLIVLTSLFILGQISFFYAHDRASGLLDPLVDYSISQQLFHPIILIPICEFIFIHLCTYGVFIAFLWFITISTGELFKLSEEWILKVGISLWFLACLFIVDLNNYYFPRSFFAEIFQAFCSNTIAILLLWVSMSILLIATLCAYINFFYRQRHIMIGSVFLGLVLSVFLLMIIDKINFFHNKTIYPKPNVIIIGLDSLRPDFVSYFNQQAMHTPTIDNFLSSATIFTQAYTPLARTFPSWVALLLAQYPRHNHARANLINLKEIVNNDTLAKHFQQAGYETFYATDEKRFSNISRAFGFNRVLGPQMGVNDFLLGGLVDFPLSNLLIKTPVARFLFPYHYSNRAADIIYDPDQFLQIVKYGLLHRQEKKPVFLAIHLCLTHWPYTWANDGLSSKKSTLERYINSIQAVDKQLQQLLVILQKAGLLDYAQVILLSDHGTTFGLPDDRIIAEQNYIGSQTMLKLMPRFKLSGQSMDHFSKDYVINTSYGQGTDVLSPKQNHILLAYKSYGFFSPIKKINEASSILDIAPTLLALLHLQQMKNIDGVSQLNYFFSNPSKHYASRVFYFETADTIDEIQTEKISVAKVIQKRIKAYQLNPADGLLMLTPAAEKSLLENKQRAILWDDWLLASFPASEMTKIAPIVANKKQFHLKKYSRPPYYVLVNVKSGQWTLNLSSSLAQKAPIKVLMNRFKAFYGDEYKY